MFAVDGDQHDGWYVFEVAGQMVGRSEGPLVVVAGSLDLLVGVGDPVSTGFPIQLGQRRLRVGVPNDQPPSTRLVPAGRCLLGQVDAVQDYLGRDGLLEV